MNAKKNALLVAITLVMAATGATAASANTAWQQHHPRREEVNARLDNQAFRVRQERRHGEISAAEAFRLRQADFRLRMQERRFARHDGGHLTPREQARLNHEENRVSRHIG
jgi:hypothetical protein